MHGMVEDSAHAVVADGSTAGGAAAGGVSAQASAAASSYETKSSESAVDLGVGASAIVETAAEPFSLPTQTSLSPSHKRVTDTSVDDLRRVAQIQEDGKLPFRLVRGLSEEQLLFMEALVRNEEHSILVMFLNLTL